MTRSRFPHPLVLLTGCIFVAALLSHILPAGQYGRRDDAATDRKVVVAGSYHSVPQKPLSFFDAVLAIPKGMDDAASIIFLVLLVGGAFTVVDKTGALESGVGWLVSKLQSRELLVIPVVSLLFCIGGVVENMGEEIIALIPVLLLLTRRLGFTPVTAVAMSVGSAAVGSAFSPINPFQVGIAQKLAGLPLLSGSGFRSVTLVLAMAIWIWGTMRYVAKTRIAAEASVTVDGRTFDFRTVLVLGGVIGAFAIFVYGVMRLGWDFDQMSALFFAMGIFAGLVGRLGVTGTADAFVEGFRSIAYAAMMIGFARGVYIALDNGQIIDTIVHGLVTPLASFPVAISAIGMIALQAVVHVPVPSVSGQAVLTMPVLVPVSDLLGLSRQVTVLTYQIGAGLSELWTPTNGVLLAVCAAAKVRLEDWLKFALPLYFVLSTLGAGAVLVGMVIGYR